MTQPIAGTYSTLVTIGSASYNPTTIAATGLLSDGLLVSYPGLTVVNAGSIAGPDVSGGFGIDLTAGGSVTNQSGGAISAYDGIYGKNAAATVVNAGSIAGSYRGIYLRAGGSVTNESGGAISGAAYGIDGAFHGGAVTVVNAGSIAGSKEGIYLNAGGSITNQSGGAIIGRNGIDGENAAVTVMNAGSITGSFGGVLLFAAGGSVTNQSGGVISGNDGIVDTAGAVTVVNAGSIAANAGGVALLAGGSVTNKSSGTISGYRAIVGSVAAMTVVNAGSIAGSGFGIYLYAGGSVTNQSGGAISGTTFGIYLYAGGSVTNQSGGVISGRAGIFAAGASTVVNAGSIGGNATSGLGVYLRTGGSLTNQAGGTISGGVDAVKFRAGDTGRLVIDPGAVFVGTVDGGNTIGAAALSTLELASASSAGTLSGLGTKYVDFAQITVDAGAQWTLQTTDTIEAGVTLTNAGTLNGALTLAPGGVLSNASTGTITAPGTAVYGMIGGAATVVNAGVIAGYNGFGGRGINLAAGGSVTNQSGGAISGSDGIYSTNAVTVVNAGSIAAHIGVYLRAGGSVTNQSGGSIATNADGIYANLDAVTVVNAGSITGARKGVGLLAGGSVTNQSGGAISGSDGIFGLAGAVTVVNAGSIAESTHDTLGAGVELFAGGSVTNQSGGTISGYDGILGAGAAVTVVNDGTIAGGTGGYAVKFFAGFANRLVIDPNAVFSGTVTGGNTIGAGQVSTLELASAGSAGTLAGLGTQFIDFAQVTVDAGAQWTLTGANTLAAGYILTDAGTLTNAGTLNGALTLAPGGVLSNASTGTITAPGTAVYGMIGGAATVVNAGVIAGYNGFGGRGINLAAGGSVTNQSGGAISGSDGIYSTNAVTVVNAGSIAAHIGVYLRAGGSVTNQSGGSIATNADGIYANLDAVTVVNAGSITGAREGVGLLAGGSVTNQSGGAISGSDGIFGLAGAVTVVNAGSIAESTHDTLGAGVELFAGGSVTNQSGGTISGYDGILGAGAAVTVVNDGTIAGGTGGYAVKFFAGFANRLVIDPNAVFSGTVTGGNTIGAGQVSTLELASAGSAGTLAGLGTQFIDFAQVTVDAGAQWTLTGANTLAAGYILTDAGTLTNAGTLNGALTLAPGGVLSNASTGTITAPGTAVYGMIGGAATVVNAGVIAGYNGSGGRGINLAAGGSVTNQSGGAISGYDGIYSTNAATVVNAGSITGAREGVGLLAGGSVTNQSGGAISGFDGIFGLVRAVTVVNAGSIAESTHDTLGAGVELFSGGSVTNQSGGVISGYDGILGAVAAVTVVNAGTISGTSYAVKFVAGFANRLVIDPDAVFSGTLTGGNTVGASIVSTLELGSGASTGTLAGLGSQYVNFGSIAVDGGANWVLASSNTFGAGGILANDGTLTLAGSLVNAGTITGVPNAAGGEIGIGLETGGSLTNQAGGTISGSIGVYAYGTATIVNIGSIGGDSASRFGDAMRLSAGGSVYNQSGGTISGYEGVFAVNVPVTVLNAGYIGGASRASSAYGVYLGAGGTVTNLATGTISGGIVAEDAPATVMNYGLVAGEQAGVFLIDGGSITNQAGGTIGGGEAVLALKDAATVENAGTIIAPGTGVDLLAGGAVTNQTGGTISGYVAIDGGNYPGGQSLTVVNYGLISGGQPVTVTSGTVSHAAGIVASAGGYVINHAGGTISGYTGIYAPGSAATVINAGSILGSNDSAGSPQYETGISLMEGGSVTNQSGGTISGAIGILTFGAATVVNAGSIGGSSYAVKFAAESANRLIADPGSVFTGKVSGGGGVLELASAASAGRLSGLGTQFVDFAQVTVDSGAQWTLQTTDTIEAGVTLTNAGTLSGPLTLAAGGVLSNASTGTVTASGAPEGSAVYGTAGGVATVVNAGVIAASDGPIDGIELKGGGSVINQSGGAISGFEGIYGNGGAVTVMNAGSIAGDSSFGDGVYLLAGGSVTNQSGGTISGYYGIYGNDAAVTVVNAGNIVGGTTNLHGVGVFLNEGGSVTNQSGGTISGHDGIYGEGAALTVVNAGTIADGTGGYAVKFAAGYANRLIIYPNAVFSGQVTGGNTIGAADVSTLELASAGSAGTLSGLGTEYVDFAQVTVDAGAQWTLTGANTLAAGYTLIDAGTLTNAGSLSGAVTLAAGGILSNAAPGTIAASEGAAVYGTTGGAATVVNAGGIAGSNAFGGRGIDLAAGGVVTNQSGGTISGQYGIFAAAASTVVNAGSIGATSSIGVYLAAGGSVTNQAGGMISGGADAVKFRAGDTGLLMIDPGAVFVGTVDGGNTIGAAALSTLELGSGAGTLSGIGTQFINFGSIAFDQGADWFIEGDAAGLGGTISGFAAGDTIEIDGITVTGSSYADGVLTLTDTSGSVSLDLTGDFTTNEFVVTNVTGGAEVTALCFCTNTLIDTPDGARKVQDLAAGDLVVTFGGAVRPISWVGTGAVLATRGRRSAATPVIVRKGALADNVPNRDLHVTKAHSLYIDDVLIPVEFLVNHRTILWDDRAQEVEIYHVELDSHDVLIANGAPAESYRDDGNRWLFQNANSVWHLPPQAPYAPVLTGGPVVDAAWRLLLDRAGPRDLPSLTEDPDLHLVIDGVRVNPEYRHGSLYGFRLPSSPKSVVIASRVGVPSELGIARDPRSLGVALRQVAIRQGGKFMLLEADDDRLTVGFHAYEADCCLRWTDGSAMLPIAAFARFDKGAEVMLHLGGATQYPDESASPAQAAA